MNLRNPVSQAPKEPGALVQGPPSGTPISDHTLQLTLYSLLIYQYNFATRHGSL